MSQDDEHSLHVTISTNQKNTWGDLFLKLLPLALEKAMSSDVRFRAGLPPGYLRYMGEAVRKKDTKVRNTIIFPLRVHLLKEKSFETG